MEISAIAYPNNINFLVKGVGPEHVSGVER